jgi:hypothetical protein
VPKPRVSANFRLAARSCLKKGGVYIVVSCWPPWWPPDQIALTGERMPRIGSSGKDDDLKRDRPPKPQSCGGGGRTKWSRR